MKVLRRLFGWLGLALLVALGLGVAILAWAHWSIRGVAPPLPDAAALLRADPRADLPVRLSYINTASQAMPRSGVLDAGLDPDPRAPYVMAHSAFVLEWADGRLFLIDLGMDRESALAFGAPIELAAGGGPIEPHADVAAALGRDASRVAGIGFTHLHTDHVSGLAGLCDALGRRVPVYWTPFQGERQNHTTWAGRRIVDDAGCAEQRLLDAGPLYEVPGFPGLAVAVAAGHTPGSQIFVARVREGDRVRANVITGDVVNQIDGVRHDVPKPSLYSLLLVPEAGDRLARVRAWLAQLERDHGARLLVGHDRLALEQSGIPPYGAD